MLFASSEPCVIGVYSPKGGVGKTTISHTLLQTILFSSNHTVAAINLDDDTNSLSLLVKRSALSVTFASASVTQISDIVTLISSSAFASKSFIILDFPGRFLTADVIAEFSKFVSFWVLPQCPTALSFPSTVTSLGLFKSLGLEKFRVVTFVNVLTEFLDRSCHASLRDLLDAYDRENTFSVLSVIDYDPHFVYNRYTLGCKTIYEIVDHAYKYFPR